MLSSTLKLEMFYLNTIEQLFLFVEQLDQLEVCLPYSRLLAGIPVMAVFQNIWWNSNKTSLIELYSTAITHCFYISDVMISQLFACSYLRSILTHKTHV